MYGERCMRLREIGEIRNGERKQVVRSAAGRRVGKSSKKTLAVLELRSGGSSDWLTTEGRQWMDGSQLGRLARLRFKMDLGSRWRAAVESQMEAETHVTVGFPALNTEIRRAALVLAIVRASAANAVRPLASTAVLELVRPDKSEVAAVLGVSQASRRVNARV